MALSQRRTLQGAKVVAPDGTQRDRFPALKKNVRLAIDFYHARDRRFTEPYFRKFYRAEPLPPGDLEKYGEHGGRKPRVGGGKNPLWNLDPAK